MRLALLLWLVSFGLLAAPWQSDVPEVKEAQLAPWYWVNRLKAPDQRLMTPKEITAFNARQFKTLPEMVTLETMPALMAADQVKGQITALAKEPPRFYANGRALSQADWARYRANLNLGAIKGPQKVAFALVVRRTVLRTYPTFERVFNKGLNLDLDRFQESGLFPGDALALLAKSRDGHWYFAQSQNYRAWVPATDLAIGSRQAVLGYGKATPFLVTTGSQVETVFNPEEPRVSKLRLDMGLRLPLVPSTHNLYGQNPYAGFVVRLPVRNGDGSLDFKAALIPRSQDVHQGYLPLTQANLVRQSFKFLGERYGWGHDYQGRDCTGFVGEVYRSFGLVMPRNSDEQGHGRYGHDHPFGKGQVAAKLKVLATAPVGSLIYLPGHVAMLLGRVDGKPWVIHDVAGLAYLKGGQFYRGTLNGVSVTPLEPLLLGPNTSYLDATYNIKTLP
ncbi:SH3 domain-containing protein [Gallaecimonas pentaromativorans]|uniref:SH3 domain-containing protein n=1 Tax=Gallaecimonas pentaromativorans TaxID=584787 RepID=UPI003A958CAB